MVYAPTSSIVFHMCMITSPVPFGMVWSCSSSMCYVPLLGLTWTSLSSLWVLHWLTSSSSSTDVYSQFKERYPFFKIYSIFIIFLSLHISQHANVWLKKGSTASLSINVVHTSPWATQTVRRHYHWHSSTVRANPLGCIECYNFVLGSQECSQKKIR